MDIIFSKFVKQHIRINSSGVAYTRSIGIEYKKFNNGSSIGKHKLYNYLENMDGVIRERGRLHGIELIRTTDPDKTETDKTETSNVESFLNDITTDFPYFLDDTPVLNVTANLNDFDHELYLIEQWIHHQSIWTMDHGLI